LFGATRCRAARHPFRHGLPTSEVVIGPPRLAAAGPWFGRRSRDRPPPLAAAGSPVRAARSWSACRGSAPGGSYPARRDCPLIRLKNAWLVRSTVERTHIRVEEIGVRGGVARVPVRGAGAAGGAEV